MLSVRATNLETFLTCPFKYKYAPDPEPNKKAFLFWRALHSLVEMSVQWVYNKTAEELILYPFEDKDRRILLAQTIKFMEHLEERKLKYIASEYSLLWLDKPKRFELYSTQSQTDSILRSAAAAPVQNIRRSHSPIKASLAQNNFAPAFRMIHHFQHLIHRVKFHE